MSFADKFLRLFHDPYIAGAQEYAQGKTVLLVDPDKMDRTYIGDLPNNPSFITYAQADRIKLQVAKQLDETYPGISAYLTESQLITIGVSAINRERSSLNNVGALGIVVMTNSSAEAEKYDKEIDCGGVPILINTDSARAICGEPTYEELVKWAKGILINKS